MFEILTKLKSSTFIRSSFHDTDDHGLVYFNHLSNMIESVDISKASTFPTN